MCDISFYVCLTFDHLAHGYMRVNVSFVEALSGNNEDTNGPVEHI